MKAHVIIHNGKASDVCRIIDLKIPEPKPDEVLVKVHYTSVNPLDCRIRSTPNPKRIFPCTLGFDVSGEIAVIGNGVKDLSIGDRIIASPDPFLPGANAEYVILKSNLCAKVNKLDLKTGAAIPLVGITAYEALFDRLKIRTGDTILIHAGAGGVGHIAVQLAKYIGCRVITTASRKESIDFCKNVLRADHVINYRKDNIKEYIYELTANKGVDLILDTVGGDTFLQSLEYLSVNGHICTILPISFDAITGYANLLKNITISYEFMGVSGSTGKHRIILDYLIDLIERKHLVPHIAEIFDFTELAHAHEYIEKKHTIGKILINVAAN